MMGGEIGVDSLPGEGSTFHVDLTLPVAEPIEAMNAATEQHDIRGLRLLVVDDHPANRMVAAAILDAAGAVVETVNDGLDALDALRRQDFDAVLMDLHMPGLAGTGALEAIRAGEAGRRNIAVVALTADLFEGDAPKLLAPKRVQTDPAHRADRRFGGALRTCPNGGRERRGVTAASSGDGPSRKRLVELSCVAPDTCKPSGRNAFAEMSG